jgi:IS1 family transposase
VQLDEKWSFVAKKQKHCDPARQADWFRGDQWDHVALGPDSRLVLEVVVGPRTAEAAQLLLEGVRDRLGGRVPELVVSDGYPAYAEVLLSVFGEEQLPPRTGRPGRPAGPRVVPPEGMCYATVHKVRERGRVTAAEARVAFGALAEGEGVSTSYLERQNATGRHRNARKGRKTYRFSKDWEVHEAVTCLTLFSYNFGWAVRALRQGDKESGYVQRTPAMAAGLTDHIWSLEEWLTLPAVQR